MTGPGQRFYEEDEAEQILRLAASMTSPIGAMSHERLLATAAELGISPEAVELAQQQLARDRTEATELSEFDQLQRREFFGHIGTYGFVCALALFGGVVGGLNLSWTVWPLGIWGICILADVGETFFRNSASYNEAFEKWRGKRRRKGMGVPVEIPANDNSDQLIDKYVHRRLDRGKDVGKGDAIRYLRENTPLTPPQAREVVEQYMLRNPGLLD